MKRLWARLGGPFFRAKAAKAQRVLRTVETGKT
jgi:hypothetical protein